MQELDKTFVAKNKKALLEEIAIQLSRARELIDNASLNSEAIAGSFAGLCSSVGCIEAYFKQYMLLRKGEITQQRMIGFAVFDEDDAEEFGPEDENDNEKPEKKAKKDEQATN